MRTEYIDKMAGCGRKYISAYEIKNIVDKKMKEKNLKSFLKEKLDELGAIRVDENIEDDK